MTKTKRRSGAPAAAAPPRMSSHPAEGQRAGPATAPARKRVSGAQPGREVPDRPDRVPARPDPVSDRPDRVSDRPDRVGSARSGAGNHLRAAARAETPAWCGTPAEPAGDEELRVRAAAFRLAVRRRFQSDTPLAEISRTVTAAVHAHATAPPVLDAEMLVREALGETVPVDGIDADVRIGVHLLLFASLADELALGDGELDALIAEAEELAVAGR
jgi:hypothetical protein